MLLQVGVKAPGSANSTILLPWNREGVDRLIQSNGLGSVDLRRSDELKERQCQNQSHQATTFFVALQLTNHSLDAGAADPGYLGDARALLDGDGDRFSVAQR